MKNNGRVIIFGVVLLIRIDKYFLMDIFLVGIFVFLFFIYSLGFIIKFLVGIGINILI